MCPGMEQIATSFPPLKVQFIFEGASDRYKGDGVSVNVQIVTELTFLKKQLGETQRLHGPYGAFLGAVTGSLGKFSALGRWFAHR